MTVNHSRTRCFDYSIERAAPADLDELVPLMVAYCAFYETRPVRQRCVSWRRS